jgi:hypothetical protein
MAVTDLAGKKFGAGSFGTLPAYEVRVLIAVKDETSSLSDKP